MGKFYWQKTLNMCNQCKSGCYMKNHCKCELGIHIHNYSIQQIHLQCLDIQYGLSVHCSSILCEETASLSSHTQAAMLAAVGRNTVYLPYILHHRHTGNGKVTLDAVLATFPTC